MAGDGAGEVGRRIGEQPPAVRGRNVVVRHRRALDPEAGRPRHRPRHPQAVGRGALTRAVEHAHRAVPAGGRHPPRPGDERPGVGVERVERVHFVRVEFGEDVHQSCAAAGVCGDNQPASGGAGAGGGVEATKRLVGQRNDASAPAQRREAEAAAGAAAEEVPAREHRQGWRSPRAQIESADRELVPDQMQRTSSRRVTVQVDHHVHRRAGGHAVPAQHQIRRAAGVPSELRQVFDHQPAGGGPSLRVLAVFEHRCRSRHRSASCRSVSSGHSKNRARVPTRALARAFHDRRTRRRGRFAFLPSKRIGK